MFAAKTVFTILAVASSALGMYGVDMGNENPSHLVFAATITITGPSSDDFWYNHFGVPVYLPR